MQKIITLLFTTGGTFIVPAGITWLHIMGIGAGGGGGGGGNRSSAQGGSGGGGGGGAKIGIVWMPVTPGASIVYSIGAGGTGGPGGHSTNGTDGGDGGTSNWGGAFSFAGGMGGSKGLLGDAATVIYSPGGYPVANYSAARLTQSTLGDYPRTGEGGWSFRQGGGALVVPALYSTGGYTPEANNANGVPGVPGSYSTGAAFGGPGGGGGSSNWNNGSTIGFGGNGGNGGTVGTPLGGNGTAGANYGAGGGGGGGGYGTGGGFGGDGGAGAPGAIQIYWVA